MASAGDLGASLPPSVIQADMEAAHTALIDHLGVHTDAVLAADVRQLALRGFTTDSALKRITEYDLRALGLSMGLEHMLKIAAGPTFAGTSLQSYIASATGIVKHNCTFLGDLKMPYGTAVFTAVSLPVVDRSSGAAIDVQRMLASVKDQSSPGSALVPGKHPPTAVWQINDWFASAVLDPVLIALQRCGVKISVKRYPKSYNKITKELIRKPPRKPEFVIYRDGQPAPIAGGDGKAPSVFLQCADLVQGMDEAPTIRSELQKMALMCKDQKWEWAFFFNLGQLYLLKKTGPDEYGITRAINAWGVNPSQREALFYWLHQAYTEAVAAAAVAVAEEEEGGEQEAAEEEEWRVPLPNQAQPSSGEVDSTQQSVQGASPTSRWTAPDLHNHSVPGGLLHTSDRVLGYGESGPVLHGSFNDAEAAVKMAEAVKERGLVKRLQHEARIMERLQDLQQRCIPRLFGAWYVLGRRVFCLAVSLVEGEHPDGGLPAALPVAMKALQDIHDRGVLHGDMRASNIMVQEVDADHVQEGDTPKYKVWFLDFGRSRLNPTAYECECEMNDLCQILTGETLHGVLPHEAKLRSNAYTTSTGNSGRSAALVPAADRSPPAEAVKRSTSMLARVRPLHVGGWGRLLRAPSAAIGSARKLKPAAARGVRF